MPISYREKSLGLVTLALILVYGHYFARVLPGHGANLTADHGWLLVGTVVSTIVLIIIGQIALAIVDTPEREDERDRQIALSAANAKSVVLAVGIIAAIAAAVLLAGNFWLVQVLLLSLVLSEIVDTVIQLYQYRRGV